jgi:hypothetical protein
MLESPTVTHQQILEVLHGARVSIVVDNHQACAHNKFDGYAFTWRDKLNRTGKNALVICLKTLKANYQDLEGELGRTIAHEAVHIAQMCKSGDGYVEPLGFKRDAEKEAFAIQDNPKEVLRIVRKYCL